jgi:hypothetical protein
VGGRADPKIWDVINLKSNLEARCGNTRCDHRSVIDAQQLGRRVQVSLWSASLRSIAHRLRCRRCGHRGGYLELSADPITGPKVGPVDEAEAKAWARLKRG